MKRTKTISYPMKVNLNSIRTFATKALICIIKNGKVTEREINILARENGLAKGDNNSWHVGVPLNSLKGIERVRTFCQNPGGFVSQENYDNDLAVVNGHSYKEKKSNNTNVAILCSHNFNHPFNQPIEYAQKVGELTNMLGAGHILVQRYGDILDGKRTWPKELAQSNLRPSLPDAVAGDITAAMPYRAMTNIINFIQAVDHVVPGFASTETLLYSPELKFYSNKIKMDTDFNTSVDGLHCLGDSSGWTRGLMMASVMGVLMGRKINSECKIQNAE